MNHDASNFINFVSDEESVFEHFDVTGLSVVQFSRRRPIMSNARVEDMQHGLVFFGSNRYGNQDIELYNLDIFNVSPIKRL